jgi:hypothetical protein
MTLALAGLMLLSASLSVSALWLLAALVVYLRGDRP